MKKGLATVVLFCYMLCAFGITFSFHHCKGELKYVNIHSQKKLKCCKGKEMPKGCCKNVKVEFKKSDDNSQSFLKFIPKVVDPAKAIISYIYSVPQSIAHPLAAKISYTLRPPPLRTAAVPIYISYSVYRI